MSEQTIGERKVHILGPPPPLLRFASKSSFVSIRVHSWLSIFPAFPQDLASFTAKIYFFPFLGVGQLLSYPPPYNRTHKSRPSGQCTARFPDARKPGEKGSSTTAHQLFQSLLTADLRWKPAQATA